MVGFEDSSVMAVSGTTVDANECDSAENRSENRSEPPLEVLPMKKKRNLPGNPDRDAEVIALSPKSLVATNRFVCEICNKGFQRDQNLQLHRRGHNLPWKLKQRTGNEIRKRVYVCPEITCVHHDPLRALGDLTGIKKHFSRKHGEKKWKCERCTKKYAVQSDWKAHMKICGSKEYRCDCGSLFSRRDSFITHRAFCEALTHESTKTQSKSKTVTVTNSDQTLQQSPPIITETVILPTTSSSPPPQPPPPPPAPLTPSTDVLSPAISFQTPEPPENSMVVKESGATTATTTVSGGSTSNNTSVFPNIYTTSSVSIEPMSLSLSSSLYLSNSGGNPSIFPSPENLLNNLHHRYLPPSQPSLSATALLQKAAQMGAKSSNTSFLHALGLASPSPSSAGGNHRQDSNNGEWNNVHIKQERDDNFRIGLGIPFATATATTTSLTDLMMGPPVPTTLDFLGLGMGGGGNGGSSGGFSAYLASTGSGFHAASAAVPLFRGINSGGNNGWDDSDDSKPDHL